MNGTYLTRRVQEHVAYTAATTPCSLHITAVWGIPQWSSCQRADHETYVVQYSCVWHMMLAWQPHGLNKALCLDIDVVWPHCSAGACHHEE